MIRLFKHYIPKSLIILSMVELCILLLSVQIAENIRFPSVGNDYFESIGSQSIIFSVVIISCMVAMGLYQRFLRDGTRGMFVRISISFAIAFVGLSFIFYLFPDLFLGRGVLAIAFSIAMLAVVISRLVYISIVDRDELNRRVLVLGSGSKANLIETLLKRRSDRRGFTVVGYLPIGGEDSTVPHNRVINNNSTIIDIVAELDIDEIVLAVTDRRNGFPVDELLDCKMSGIEIVDVQTFFERQAGRVIIELLQPSWLIFSDGFSHGISRNFIKRSFDIVASLILLLFASPILLVAMLLVYLGDKGPIFYRQVRVGKNWQLIQVMKLRSMKVDAEKGGTAQFAKANDDRITDIGKIIRKTRIDELPQLFNVLKGDMSFVGPRPERPEFVSGFSESIPFYAERHRVKPGITGWAQICYPYGASEKDTIEKLQYDLYYVKNYSIFLDLTILFQTADVILWGKGAR